MKITKRTIKACEATTDLPAEGTIVVESAEPVVTCPYTAAIDSIMNAIESLGAVAQNDELARESIANLSVVLFDLKN